jgi:hypothetical protein
MNINYNIKSLIPNRTWNDDNRGKLDPKLGQQGSHVSGLPVQLVLLVGQGEDPQLAVAELLPGGEDVGQQQSEASIIVQPPDVYVARVLGTPLVTAELDYQDLCLILGTWNWVIAERMSLERRLP